LRAKSGRNTFDTILYASNSRGLIEWRLIAKQGDQFCGQRQTGMISQRLIDERAVTPAASLLYSLNLCLLKS
jgi:hypothetical protein